MSGIGNWLFGSEDSFKKLDTMSPEQKKMFQQFFQMMGGPGGGMGGAMEHQQQLLDPSSEAYQKMAQPYMNQFNQETIPGLAERFAGAGGGMGGGLSSSGFGQALSSAGSNLQGNLAAMKTGMQGQAANSIMQQFMQMMGMQPFAYGHQQSSPGMLPTLIGNFAQGAGKAFGGGF